VIANSMYYGCFKDALEAETKRLVGITTRTATPDEVGRLSVASAVRSEDTASNARGREKSPSI
jgi:hypothetical protein